MRVLSLLAGALLLVVAWLWWSPSAIEQPPGVLVADEPRQESVSGMAALEVGDYRLQPLARFELEARVLSRRNYSSDREAALSPLDLALGWGPMSDSSVLAQIDISQGGRFYRWKVEQFPIPRRQIELHSANMHIIPADDTVAAQLDEVRAGEVIRLAGLLVEARAADGWRWKSSLTRGDTGKGACELFYVQRLEWP